MTDVIPTDERVARFQRLLAGCSACDYDEAGGALMDHCSKCQRAITTEAYALVITDGMQLKTIAEITQLVAERDAARIVAKKRLELLIAEGVI